MRRIWIVAGGRQLLDDEEILKAVVEWKIISFPLDLRFPGSGLFLFPILDAYILSFPPISASLSSIQSLSFPLNPYYLILTTAFSSAMKKSPGEMLSGRLVNSLKKTPIA